MREDVLGIIKAAKDVTNVVVLTHNIDFVFVQSLVIPALRKCGSPDLTIFADAECAAQSYQYQARVLNDLGQRYRVVSVAMPSGFRFHPKAVLLSGPQSATLLVGSGNVTFGGWRENGEVWCRYDTEGDGTRAFAAFRVYLHDVLGLCSDSDALRPEIEEAFDANTRLWAASMGEPGVLLGRAGQGRALVDQIGSVAGDAGLEKLYVCAPYFDEDAEALRTLARQLGSPSTTVLVQNHRTNLLQSAADTLDSLFTLKAATYQHRETTNSNGEEQVRDALLHAKFYAVERDGRVAVFAGSANCSRAALTLSGSAGNAELMAHVTMAALEFEKAFLNELLVADEAPILVASVESAPPPAPAGSFIRIRAARIDGGLLRVAFEADAGTTVVRAEVGQGVIGPVQIGNGFAIFGAGGHPRMVVLVGTSNDDALVRSPAHWIDDEHALRTSARGRSLAESIDTRVRHDRWGIGAWTEVLAELVKHLQYMPMTGSRGRTAAGSAEGEENGPVAFVWADVFSDTYGLPVGARFGHALNAGIDGRVGSLRAILLRYYGIAQPEQQAPNASVAEDAERPDVVPAGDDGDGGDAIVEIARVANGLDRMAGSDKERNRAIKLVRQVAARLGEPQFLSERRPEVLAADLKVAAVLLRVGLGDGWLSDQDFFNATLAIWLPLFFNAGGDEKTGWLERRYLTAPVQKEFAAAISSVELAAALGCWALSAPAKAATLEHVRFNLASALGVARLPWLWQTGGNERIAREISEMLAHTSGDHPQDWREIERRWLTLVRRGYALGRLEESVESSSIVQLRDRIRQGKVTAGELLWQKGAGFCVATRDCERTEGHKCELLVLQQGCGTKIYMGPFLMPLAGLLDESVLPDAAIPAKARRELLTMVEDLRVSSTSS